MTDDIPAALFTFFEAMPRQGPGADAITAALFERFRPLLPDSIAAADMGCGSGSAALVLAEKGCAVTGVDIHPPFLDALSREAAARHLEVGTLCASMLDSGLPEQSLDLVWSEGAVFTVGFDAALDEFQRLLRPGGIAVVSECSWFVRHPALEAAEFWATAYPGMRSVGGNVLACEDHGWRILHTERLPSAVWEEGFYGPMQALCERLAPDADAEMAAMIEENIAEIALFRAHHQAYGYIFYGLQKLG